MTREYTPGEPRTERIKDIDRWAEKHGYPKPEIHNPEAGIQLIVIAEKHLPEYQSAQVELVGLIRPSFMLHR